MKPFLDPKKEVCDDQPKKEETKKEESIEYPLQKQGWDAKDIHYLTHQKEFSIPELGELKKQGWNIEDIHYLAKAPKFTIVECGELKTRGWTSEDLYYLSQKEQYHVKEYLARKNQIGRLIL